MFTRVASVETITTFGHAFRNAPAGAYIVKQIKAMSSKPVKYLIYTHYHGDHNLGAREFLFDQGSGDEG